jgi:predicted TIM-barrel fold metal-dependent hydrolase
MMTLYEACQTVGLPVLFHLDDIRCIDEAGFPHLKKVLETFPQLPLIGHECGFWAGISGDCTADDLHGYPKRPVVPGGAIDKLMDAHRNLYCDLSGPGGVGAFQRDPEFGRRFLLRWADRVLFGTDYLATGQDIPHFAFFESLELPDDVKYKIYRGNAIRLLKLNLNS